MDNIEEKPQRRKVLVQYFKQGRMPTEESFAQLINSSVNKLDDGFSRHPLYGQQLEATAPGPTPQSEQRLLAFYRGWQQLRDECATWFVGLLGLPASDSDSDNGLGLSFSEPQGQRDADATDEDNPPQPPPVRLYLAPGGNVGIGTTNPGERLSVAGFVGSVGRMGTFQNEPSQPGNYDSEPQSHYTGTMMVDADGEWHDIISGLRGLWGFEVVAAAYGPHLSGTYAMGHAIALGVHGQQQRIKIQEASYRGWRQHLLLRWHIEEPGTEQQPEPLYGLQIRTRKSFGAGASIVYHITCLFNDCRPEPK